MAKIQLLNDEVIGKIAAGEVVERPAAAIKELVENSLDAGASAVTVEIRDGGISYFRVTDNGSGIPSGDIRMAFERHATSKITRAQDLHSIATLGFRGEALASIAAVSHVTCTTRTKDDASGIKVRNDGGIITSIEEAACPEGTTFVVRDLFYNTPVRLKFLKKPVTEAGFVTDLMMRLILSRPDVSFRYISQGKTLYHSAGDGKMESAVFSIYGSEMLRSMRKVEGNQSGVMIRGYVGIGESARGNRGHQSFFINGRYMKSNILSAAVESACRERVMIGKFPSCVLHLTMPYETVDVNVHPNKLEVRFQNEGALFSAVESIVLDALVEKNAFVKPVEVKLTAEKPAATPVQVTRQDTQALPVAEKKAAVSTASASSIKPVVEVARQVVPKAPIPAAPAKVAMSTTVQPLRPAPHMLNEPIRRLEDDIPKAPEAKAPVSVPAEKQIIPAPIEEKVEQVPSFLPDAPKPMKLLGVAFNTFILVEYEDHLLMIDQHAVHERLLFDRLMKAYDRHEAGQELLIPLLVTVTRREQELLLENQELLEGIGLTIEPYGDQEMAIRSIPMVLGNPQAKDFLHDIIGQLESERGSITIEKRRASILQLACKKAVKGGDRLSEEEIRHLVTQMIDRQVTPTCPHGRPLVISLSHQELDKRFRRIQ
ncbi:MAG: DNA mismatch repair endonuclease MutL [Clostridiales bacterium]|nr:DNA mismatch repair endonuclease MutL [Clostridiales bacterium]